MCVPIEVHECFPGGSCTSGTTLDAGVPAFLKIDFERLTVEGPNRSSTIRFMEESKGELFLLGMELGYGWTMALDLSTGEMAVTITNKTGGVTLFGSCTAI
jgi:hypothetical protein